MYIIEYKILKEKLGEHMYRIAICDDNEKFLELFEEKFKQYCENASIHAILNRFSDSDVLMERVEEKRSFDAFILDIEMPIFSGIDIARTVRENSNSAVIIFLTAFENFAKDGYGMNVSNYLLKSHLESDLEKVLEQMFFQLRKMKNDKIYTISNQRKFIKLFQKDIIYVYKSQKNAVFLLEEQQEEWERITLQEVYSKMHNPDMMMVDRGLIVNLHHIRSVFDDKIVMDNGQELLTSKNQIKNLKKYLSSYWGSII